MKKTDKIELRVDHEEKERLNAIAERRGQTVSDVMREALAGDLGIVRPKQSPWPMRIAMGACILSLLAVALSWRTSSAPSFTVDPVYPTSFNVSVSTLGQRALFDLPMVAGSETSLELLSQDNQTVRLNLSTRAETQADILFVDLEACLIRTDSCEPLVMPSLSINMRPASNSSARSSARLEDREILTVTLAAKTYRPGQSNEGV